MSETSRNESPSTASLSSGDGEEVCSSIEVKTMGSASVKAFATGNTYMSGSTCENSSLDSSSASASGVAANGKNAPRHVISTSMPLEKPAGQPLALSLDKFRTETYAKVAPSVTGTDTPHEHCNSDVDVLLSRNRRRGQSIDRVDSYDHGGKPTPLVNYTQIEMKHHQPKQHVSNGSGMPYLMRSPPSQRRPNVGEIIRRIESPRPLSHQNDDCEDACANTGDPEMAHDSKVSINGANRSEKVDPVSPSAMPSSDDDEERVRAEDNEGDSKTSQIPSHHNVVVPPGVSTPEEAKQWTPIPWANLQRPRGGPWMFSYPLLTSVAPDPEQCPCRMRGSSPSAASSPPSQSPESKKRARAGCEKTIVYDWHNLNGEEIKVAGKAVSRAPLAWYPGSSSPSRNRNANSPDSTLGSPFRGGASREQFEHLRMLSGSSKVIDANVENSDGEQSGDDSDGDGDGNEGLPQCTTEILDVKEDEDNFREADIRRGDYGMKGDVETREEYDRQDKHDRLRSLNFDSHFESGNLLRAVKVGPFEYDLLIRPDLNTSGFQQWWYFSLCNTHPPGWERQLENARMEHKRDIEVPNKQDASMEAAAELGMPESALDQDHPSEDAAERDLRMLGKGPGGTGLDWTGAMTYRFNIVNLCKPDSMYNRGMQPVMYSCRDAEDRGIGWRRVGRDVCYFGNELVRGGDNPSGLHHYTLTFKVSFSRPDNVYLLAHSVPYTWTDNLRHIDALLTLRPHCVRRSVLCHTLSGRECDLLTITDFDTGELGHPGSGPGAKEASKDHFLEIDSSNSHGKMNGPEDYSTPASSRGGWLSSTGRTGNASLSSNTNYGSSKDNYSGSFVGDVEDADGLGNTHLRRVIVVTARVHPGETPASWITKGFIDFISSKAPAAQLLRRMFVFKIVPMINPDGVFYGNNRCSLASVDLNRQWLKPTPHMHPTIYNSKSMIRHLHATRECALYLDMHAHSRKGNVFMYGVEEKNRMKPKVRLFPALMDKCPFSDALFSFKDCTFNVGRGREATARVVVARELLVKHSYTVESSYCGPDEGPLAKTQFNTRHLEMVGVGMADTLLQIHHPNPAMKKFAQQELGEISLRIRGDKRAKRLLARAQEKRKTIAAERFSTWAQRHKRELKKVRLGEVPESVVGNTFHCTEESSITSRVKSWSDDWGATAVEGYSSIVQNGVCMKLPTGLIAPEWYKQLGMGVGLFWNHERKSRQRNEKAKVPSEAKDSEDDNTIKTSLAKSAPPAPSVSKKPFTSIGVGGAQTNRSMRKLNHMMFGGSKGNSGYNGHTSSIGRKLSGSARGQMKVRYANTSAIAAAASRACTESGYKPYTHYGFLSKQIFKVDTQELINSEAKRKYIAKKDKQKNKSNIKSSQKDMLEKKDHSSKSRADLFKATSDMHMHRSAPKRVIQTASGRTRRADSKSSGFRLEVSGANAALTLKIASKNGNDSSPNDCNTKVNDGQSSDIHNSALPRRPAEGDASVLRPFELENTASSNYAAYMPVLKPRPFVAGGAPSEPVASDDGSSHAVNASIGMYESNPSLCKRRGKRRPSSGIEAAHAKAKANLEKAAAHAKRRADCRNTIDGLNPKLLYASMPPRARKAIERRLNTMLSNGGEVNNALQDSGDSDCGSRSRVHSKNDAQRTHRGRIVGKVLSSSPAKGDKKVATAMIVDTSNDTPVVQKKRPRRVRMKHRRGSGHRNKKGSRRRQKKESLGKRIPTTVKSAIHRRQENSLDESAPFEGKQHVGSTGLWKTSTGNSQNNHRTTKGSSSYVYIDDSNAALDSMESTTSSFQGSYAAAYLRQSLSEDITKHNNASLIKVLTPKQTDVSRPSASKNVSNYLSSSYSATAGSKKTNHPHPPAYYYAKPSDGARNLHATKPNSGGRPVAMNSYNSGKPHRSIYSPHLRQYRKSTMGSNTGSSMATASPRTRVNNTDVAVSANSTSRNNCTGDDQRPYSSNGSTNGDADFSGSGEDGRKQVQYLGAVGSAAAAAAARRGDRLASKRFLPNLEGSAVSMDRERWGLAFSPVTSKGGREETATF